MRETNSNLALIFLLTAVFIGGGAAADETVSGPFYMFTVPLEGAVVGTAESGTEVHPDSVLSFFANGNGDIQAPRIFSSAGRMIGTDNVPLDQLVEIDGCTWTIDDGEWVVDCPGGLQGIVVALRSVAATGDVDFQVQSWTPFTQPSPTMTIDGFTKAPDGLMVPEAMVDK